MTKFSRYDKRYGQWAGNPQGRAPDFTKCAESVYPPRQWVSRQCTRACGYGPDGAYCKTHAKRHEAKE